MQIERVFETLAEDDDVGILSNRELDGRLQACARLASWTAAREAAYVAEAARRSQPGPRPRPHGGDDGGSNNSDNDDRRSAEKRLKDKTGTSGKSARDKVRRAEGLGRLPAVATALAAGHITGEHASVFAQAHRDHPAEVERDQQILLDIAVDAPVDRFRHELNAWKRSVQAGNGEDALAAKRRRRRAHFNDTDDGLLGLFAAFDPVWGAEVERAVEYHADRLWRAEQGAEATGSIPRNRRNQLYADAIVEIARLSMGSDSDASSPAPPHASVVAVISINWLLGQLDTAGFSELADGTPIPVSEVRKLAAQVGIVPLVMASDGTVLDMGRASRTATPDQRLALLVRDGACAHPDCDQLSTSFTHAHHIQQWADGGRTALELLLNACTAHHHDVHDRGWSIEKHEDDVWWLHRPDGSPYQPLRRRRPPPDH